MSANERKRKCEEKEEERISRQRVLHYEKIALGKALPKKGNDFEESLGHRPPGGWPGGWPNLHESAYGLKKGESGVTVLKVLDEHQLHKARQEMEKACEEFPEFNFNGQSFDDISHKLAMGAFRGLGIPSSFNNLFVRKMRKIVMLAVLESGVIPTETATEECLRFEQIVDRLMIRPPGVKPDAETWHRDEAMAAEKGDRVFGGWLNLDKDDQFFSLVPHSANEVGVNHGFAKIPRKHQSMFKEKSKLVRIPPGGLMIFDERTIHEVRSVPSKQTTRRLFTGWRTTLQSDPLTPRLDEITKDQEAFPLKSAQDKHPQNSLMMENKSSLLPPQLSYFPGPPAMWSPFHFCNNPHLLIAFGENFKPEVLKTISYKKETSVQAIRYPDGVKTVPLYMPSLKDLSERSATISMYPPYADDEVALLKPNRKWTGLLAPSALCEENPQCVSFALPGEEETE